MRTYVFDETKGAGVPGLPHVITDEEAAALGVSELLKAAIHNGSYVEQTPTLAPLQMSTNGVAGTKKKE